MIKYDFNEANCEFRICFKNDLFKPFLHKQIKVIKMSARKGEASKIKLILDNFEYFTIYIFQKYFIFLTPDGEHYFQNDLEGLEQLLKLIGKFVKGAYKILIIISFNGSWAEQDIISFFSTFQS